jgi:hypothetical protein
MKELLQKVFNKKISTPIFVGFGVFSIFTFIVFPGLTVANTIINILSAIVGLFSLVFIFYYLKMDTVIDKISHIEPGETELDYIPKEEVEELIKKSKKKSKVVIHPNVKTKNK